MFSNNKAGSVLNICFFVSFTNFRWILKFNTLCISRICYVSRVNFLLHKQKSDVFSLSPRSWWLFAYNRILNETRQKSMRRTWDFVTTRVKLLNSYCRSYRRKLLCYLQEVSTCLFLNNFMEPRYLSNFFVLGKRSTKF